MKKIELALIYIFPFLFFNLSCTDRDKKDFPEEAVENQHIIEVNTAFAQFFESCEVTGSVIIYDQQRGKYIASDAFGIYEESLPASTFKIINLMIALETETITDENEIVKWPGETDTALYGYRPDIYHDITVKEAFQVSAGWAFIELAKKIGKEKYLSYLFHCDYGNKDILNSGDDFWNFGAFGISPMNQIQFLRKVVERKNLPFSQRNINILKSVMGNGTKNGYLLRAKTGWTRVDGQNIGWWVGYLEKGDERYFFATRLYQDRSLQRSDFGSCRKSITYQALEASGVK